MKKIGIVGSEGYISGFLKKKLDINNEIVKIDKINNSDIQYLDLEKPDQFNYTILDDIDIIVFTAAISGPDLCAKEYDMCWNINVNGTSYFINQALKRSCKVLFFSSDAVFGEDNTTLFNEDSTPNPKTSYGKMKYEIEEQFKENEGFKAIRLSYVVSRKDRFVSYCLNSLKQDQLAEVFHPFYRNCITITDVVSVVEYLCNEWSNYKSTFLNIAGTELVSRVRIADEISRNFNAFQYKIVVPGDEFFANRPAITQMTSKYLYSMNILERTSFTEKIKKELENINYEN